MINSQVFWHSCSYPTYEEWKPFKHWIRRGSWWHWVLILPMRNGNLLFLISRKLVSNFRSYPTYEEWKQYFRNNLRITSLYSSYPTYEEWKLSTVSPVFLTSIGSYPTYEEWKTKRRACSTSLRLIINNCYNNCCQIQNINFIFTDK